MDYLERYKLIKQEIKYETYRKGCWNERGREKGRK